MLSLVSDTAFLVANKKMETNSIDAQITIGGIISPSRTSVGVNLFVLLRFFFFGVHKIGVFTADGRGYRRPNRPSRIRGVVIHSRDLSKSI